MDLTDASGNVRLPAEDVHQRRCTQILSCMQSWLTRQELRKTYEICQSQITPNIWWVRKRASKQAWSCIAAIHLHDGSSSVITTMPELCTLCRFTGTLGSLVHKSDSQCEQASESDCASHSAAAGLPMCQYCVSCRQCSGMSAVRQRGSPE